MKKRKVLSLFLALVMALGLSTSVMAQDTPEIDAAQKLYDLGLFQGTGTAPDGTPDFSLERVPTRSEGIAMLVRLLGKDAEAKAGKWSIPFTDVADWAKPYVGYAYENGLTKGVSSTTFGGDILMDAAQYITLTLRAMGYVDGEDFQWDAPWQLSDRLHITDGTYGADTPFTRGDVATISYHAIALECKNEATLAQKLIDSGVFTLEQAVAAGVAEDTPVTRAEMAHFLAEYLTADDATGEDISYQDVTKDTPHHEDIAFVARADLMLGVSSRKFYPDSTVTVAESSVLLSRLLTIHGYTAPTDISRQDWADAWYGSSMSQMVDLGVFSPDVNPTQTLGTTVLNSMRDDVTALIAAAPEVEKESDQVDETLQTESLEVGKQYESANGYGVTINKAEVTKVKGVRTLVFKYTLKNLTEDQYLSEETFTFGFTDGTISNQGGIYLDGMYPGEKLTKTFNLIVEDKELSYIMFNDAAEEESPQEVVSRLSGKMPEKAFKTHLVWYFDK